MTEHATEFAATFGRVEPTAPDVDNASAAHLEVRHVLETDEALKEMEIDTILIGSYKRRVSIRRVKDVDVFSKLPAVDTMLTSQQMLDRFAAALSDHFGDRLKPQDRSIKVEFPDYDLHVDVVPARPCGAHWEIPDRPTDVGDEAWAVTNPERYGKLTTAMNERFDGNYVPLVKLFRQTRRTLLGDARPGGHFIEVLAYRTFADMVGDETTWSRQRLYVAGLRGIADELRSYCAGGAIGDPAVDGKDIVIRATEAEKSDAASKFDQAATNAAEALADTDICRSALVFQELLGENSDGELVFEMPDYCDSRGRMLASVVPASRTVSRSDGRFA